MHQKSNEFTNCVLVILAFINCEMKVVENQDCLEEGEIAKAGV